MQAGYHPIHSQRHMKPCARSMPDRWHRHQQQRNRDKQRESNRACNNFYSRSHVIITLSYGYISSVTSPSFAFIPLIGSVNQNVVPLPSSLSNQILPPDDSTIALMRYSPRPVPSVSTFFTFSARKNF